ncbi:MAG: copper-binding protein [Myxococcales bacterium]|nr:MAG: copper-binding protein [Myxococcales bacterium]
MGSARRWQLTAIAVSIALFGCGGEPPGSAKPGHGVVRGLDAQAAVVTIEHGAIPDLMMAMTMPFPVDDPAILEGVAIGDEIDFLVKRDGERFVVTQIRPKLK